MKRPVPRARVGAQARGGGSLGSRHATYGWSGGSGKSIRVGRCWDVVFPHTYPVRWTCRGTCHFASREPRDPRTARRGGEENVHALHVLGRTVRVVDVWMVPIQEHRPVGGNQVRRHSTRTRETLLRRLFFLSV